MTPRGSLGLLLIICGLLLVMAGLFALFGPRIPFLGRLPGDIRIQRESFSLYIPITTSILLSLLITLIIYLVQKAK